MDAMLYLSVLRSCILSNKAYGQLTTSKTKSFLTCDGPTLNLSNTWVRSPFCHRTARNPDLWFVGKEYLGTARQMRSAKAACWRGATPRTPQSASHNSSFSHDLVIDFVEHDRLCGTWIESRVQTGSSPVSAVKTP